MTELASQNLAGRFQRKHRDNRIVLQHPNALVLRTLHIVMKLTHANRQPVAKLSDSPGKLLDGVSAPE